MKKRVLALCLAFVLVFTMIPSAFAAQLPFEDVPEYVWYRDAVQYCYDNSLINGTSPTTFSPDKTMNRAMLVTVLYRMAGSPATNTAFSFSDVENDTWYSQAVAWAKENAVVEGNDKGLFQPNGAVTREQMVTILYRYSLKQGKTCPVDHTLRNFVDRGAAHEYALPGLSWAVRTGILTGVTASQLKPSGTATRAQAAAILMRYFQLNDSDPSNDPAMATDPTPATMGNTIVAGQSIYFIGMTTTELVAMSGEPAEKLATFAGYEWYVYGTQTYRDFMLAGVSNGRVVSLLTTGPGFSYMGIKMGDQKDPTATEYCDILKGSDRAGDGGFLCIQLTESDLTLPQTAPMDQQLAGEAKATFHLCNAFRLYHGQQPLIWSEPAAAAGRAKSQEMVSTGVFELDSDEAMLQRLIDQGIDFDYCAESVVYDVDAINAYYTITQGDIRPAVLEPIYTHCGCGAAYDSEDPEFPFGLTSFYYNI